MYCNLATFRRKNEVSDQHTEECLAVRARRNCVARRRRLTLQWSSQTARRAFVVQEGNSSRRLLLIAKAVSETRSARIFRRPCGKLPSGSRPNMTNEFTAKILEDRREDGLRGLPPNAIREIVSI